jgi:hypothetical protein
MNFLRLFLVTQVYYLREKYYHKMELIFDH